MKKIMNIKNISGILMSELIIAVTVIFTGCKKTPADSTAPMITMNGRSTCFFQKGSLWNDPGASAIDDMDGTLTVNSSGGVSTSLLGTYTITYTAKDMSGNISTKSRTIYVVDVEGTYSVMRIAPYPATAAGDTTYYNEFLFLAADLSGQLNYTTFSNYVNGLAYSYLQNTTQLTIPSQTINCGAPAIDRNFSGSGTISNTLAPHTKITLNFTEVSGTTTVTRCIYNKL